MTDKSRKPIDSLDKVCLDFEHCSECLYVDGCDDEINPEPRFNGTVFTCDHLSGCAQNKCLCSVNTVNQLVKLIDVTPTAKLTFNQFMDTCVTEVDPSINTQMVTTNARAHSKFKCNDK